MTGLVVAAVLTVALIGVCLLPVALRVADRRATWDEVADEMPQPRHVRPLCVQPGCDGTVVERGLCAGCATVLRFVEARSETRAERMQGEPPPSDGRGSEGAVSGTQRGAA